MHEAETPNEEGQEDDELDAGSIFGIVMACSVAAALIGILIVVAIAYVLRDRKKRSGKAELKSTSPDSLTRYAVTSYACKIRSQMLTQINELDIFKIVSYSYS